MANLRRIKYEEWPRLRRLPNVNGVETGPKMIRGETTAIESIRVLVEKKLPLSELRKKDVVPDTLQGVRTDVVQVGKVVIPPLMEIKKPTTPNRTERWEKVPGGVSVACLDVTAGTNHSAFYAIGPDGQRKLYLLSNWHVFANSNSAPKGQLIVQPGPYDGGTRLDNIAELEDFIPISFEGGNGGCPIAKVARYVANTLSAISGSSQRLELVQATPNRVDAAVAIPNGARAIDEYTVVEIGKIKGMKRATVGMKMVKSGRSSAITRGTVLAIDSIVQVNYGEHGIATMYEQIRTTHMLIGGDSGSAGFEDNNKEQEVAIGFAGSDSDSFFNHLYIVFEELGLEPVFDYE